MKNKKNKESIEIQVQNNIARFFGFRPMEAPLLVKQDFDAVKKIDPNINALEKAALLRIYFSEKKPNLYQLANTYIRLPFSGLKNSSSNHKKIEALLVSLGSPKSVSECLSIQTAMAILEEFGYKHIEVKINSIGDKDSISTFQKNISLFVRKNISSFPPSLRQAIKKDIHILLKEKKEEWKSFEKICPKPIDFLSEQSRLHLKQVLEFLETMEIPYSLDPCLLSDFDIGSEIVFSLKSEDEDLAYGFRFNRMAKKIGLKKDLPAIMLKISAKIEKVPKRNKNLVEKPKFFLVQFGSEARLKSFAILKELYNSKIGVLHILDKDRLDDQMNIAEKSGVPYIMLIGQKEALDGNVVIRNVATRAQQLIPISNISDRIKDL